MGVRTLSRPDQTRVASTIRTSQLGRHGRANPTTLRQIKAFLRVARDSQQLNARPRDSSTLSAREGLFPRTPLTSGSEKELADLLRAARNSRLVLNGPKT